MKMRIISGKLGGRQFNAPKSYHTHPMSEKIRGAVFNILGDVAGLSALDAFGGSGAVALEALSRGASAATIIELDKGAIRTIKESVESLGLVEEAAVIQGNIKGWSNNNTDKLFDIVICDPPYDAVLALLIEKLSRHVAPGGSLVLSWPSSEPIPELPDMTVLRHKTYGNATLVFYRKI